MRQSLISVSEGSEGKFLIRLLIISKEKGFFLCFSFDKFLFEPSTILDKNESLAGSFAEFIPGMKPCNHLILSRALEVADLPSHDALISSRYWAMHIELKGISMGRPDLLQNVKSFRREKQYFSTVDGFRDIQMLLIILSLRGMRHPCQNC